jgi:hypothetical protein
MTLIIICLVSFVLILLALALCLFLFVTKQCLKPENDTEFPGAGMSFDSHREWFPSFHTFKKLAYYFAEKDEEIKRYLMGRKSRHDSHAASVSDSNVDRKNNSSDIQSDLQ